MKRIFNATMFLALLLCTSDYLSAQWVDSPLPSQADAIVLDNFPTKKEVGIGANNPRATLHVKSGPQKAVQLYLNTTNAGDEPDFTLAQVDKTRAQIRYSQSLGGFVLLTDETKTDLGALELNKLGLFVDGGNQSVGIKTAVVPTGFDMAVAGKIICEEMRVQLEANWPDYVFQPEYELMPLSELEASIEENSHLPGVPTAEVIESKGLDLGDISKIQMEKIEELTLYLIEMKKDNDELRARIEILESSK